MDRLTSKFQMALADAQSLAVGRDHQFIEPVHLMTALLDQEGGTVRHLLAQADVNVNQLRSALGDALGGEFQVLVEGRDGDVGGWSGYTPNYLRVQLQDDSGADLENRIVRVRCLEVSDDGERMMAELI